MTYQMQLCASSWLCAALCTNNLTCLCDSKKLTEAKASSYTKLITGVTVKVNTTRTIKST